MLIFFFFNSSVAMLGTFIMNGVFTNLGDINFVCFVDLIHNIRNVPF